MPRKADSVPGKLSGTQSIERALTLLREIAAHNRNGSRLLDLSSRTSLQRPTVHRMLKCLAAENMVQQDPDSHRYFLGPMVFELGLTAAPRFNLREICHPALTRIADATGEAVCGPHTPTDPGGLGTDGVDRLHVDIQSMGFAISGGNATRLYVGNDGGVWSTDVSGGGAGSIDWVNHNGPGAGSSMALGTLQYYPGHAIHPGNPDFTIGGTQDNGTHIYSGSLGWIEAPVAFVPLRHVELHKPGRASVCRM